MALNNLSVIFLSWINTNILIRRMSSQLNYNINQMGNSHNPDTKKGYRIVGMQQNSPAAVANLQILLDYIIQPEPNNIVLTQQNVQLQIYSITERKIRSVNIKPKGQQLGMTVRLQNLNQCILKVVNVLKGSPFEKYQIKASQDYIIGMLEQPYENLKQFINVIKQASKDEKASISLGIFNNSTGIRIVKIQVKELNQWKLKGKGILGCELAEGWVHRIPNLLPSIQASNVVVVEESSNTSVQQIRQEKQEMPVQVPKNNVQEEITSLMRKLEPELFVSETKFNGVVRCKLEEDSSSFCKCIPTNKYCEYCSYYKQGNHYFYCKKINKVFVIAENMLLPV